MVSRKCGTERESERKTGQCVYDMCVCLVRPPVQYIGTVRQSIVTIGAYRTAFNPGIDRINTAHIGTEGLWV